VTIIDISSIDLEIHKLQKKITAIKDLREQKRKDADIRLVYSDVHCNVSLEIYERALQDLKLQKHQLALQNTYEMLA
jgi:hypothetical protein